ncbi:MAG: ferritin-like domain-containing protein [Desulfotignum sp.]|nr:ferritin-like domain-containing protein [Desulfotignum sp.]
MENQKLISMLNKDMAEEHAAIIRYLVHSYLEGEDTPLGAKLLSRCREEMWHMHWLGMVVGELGGEPNLDPAPYPYDPTNRATIFKSYVDYEKSLIPHYNAEAEKVDNPHIKRVLQREAWESAMHAKKFERMLTKLDKKEAEGLPGEENELPDDYVEKFQSLVEYKYNLMLRHIRDSWVFQKEDMFGWKIMDFAMTQMKQLAHLSEPVAENGIPPRFTVQPLNLSSSIGPALAKTLEDVESSIKRHQALKNEKETQKHAGEITNLELSIDQETYQAEEIKDWLKRK